MFFKKTKLIILNLDICNRYFNKWAFLRDLHVPETTKQILLHDAYLYPESLLPQVSVYARYNKWFMVINGFTTLNAS